jgi:hypothetical protein
LREYGPDDHEESTDAGHSVNISKSDAAQSPALVGLGRAVAQMLRNVCKHCANQQDATSSTHACSLHLRSTAEGPCADSELIEACLKPTVARERDPYGRVDIDRLRK